MPLSILFLLLCLLTIFPPLFVADIPNPRGYYINCGASQEELIGNIEWIPDQGFINVGNVSKIETPGLVPMLSTLRFFPDVTAHKYCFIFPVVKGDKYLLRSTYYYGGFDGGEVPPVFDQIVEGTKWSTVDTVQAYANGLTAYYEIIVMGQGRTLSFCLARNNETASSPFVSAIELINLDNSMYDGPDFKKNALSTVARHRFGHTGDSISYPDDPFNRYWVAFSDSNSYVDCQSNVTASDFWNNPPVAAFLRALTTSRGKELVVQWPPLLLPDAVYYLALYFQDNRTPSPYSWRVFDVSVNGKEFYKGINVSTNGAMVFGTQWALSGQTKIVLTPGRDSPVGPVINAGEILQIVPFGDKTVTRDVIAMEELARSLKDPPPDWSGDPCFPRQYPWTGVTCSQDGTNRVQGLNLTNFGLSGSLPNTINNLTALTELRISGNRFFGPIPDLRSLRNLVTLQLQDNQLSGPIPSSLGELPSIREIFLQNNKLSGHVPRSLARRTGVDIRLQPGNNFS